MAEFCISESYENSVISLSIKKEGFPCRVLQVVDKKKVIIREKPLSKSDLHKIFLRHVELGSSETMAEMATEYYHSMNNQIKKEIRAIRKSLKRIEALNACSNAADEILIDLDKYRDSPRSS